MYHINAKYCYLFIYILNNQLATVIAFILINAVGFSCENSSNSINGSINSIKAKRSEGSWIETH